MKAAVMEDAHQPMVIKEVPDPIIGHRDVLIRIRACGVCHTDLLIADGVYKSFGMDPFPYIPGHEPAGVVEQAGAEVTHLKQGDRVGVYALISCGRCRYCLSGEEESCVTLFSQPQSYGFTMDGGYAQYMAVPADCAISLPPELDFTAAAPLFCAGLTVYPALKNAHLRPGQRAAVLGIGGLGHLAIPIARAMGAEVIAITSTEEKAELSRNLGAHHVISGGDDIGQKLLEMGGADVVLSTIVDPEPIGKVIQGISPGGALVLTGITTDPLPIVPAALAFKQHRIIGSFIGSRRDMQELLQLAVQHDIRPINEVYPLEETNEVHARLRANQVRFRAVLTPD